MSSHNSNFEEKVDKFNKENEFNRNTKTISVAMPGIGSFIAKIYQLFIYLAFQNFEFLTNIDYLELRERRILSVALIPYMILVFSPIFLPLMVVWCGFTVIYMIG